MTPEQAEAMLRGWAVVTCDRDDRVRAAIDAGLSKHRVHQITGIGWSTIDRILSAPAVPAGANNVPAGGPDDC
jgi:hypothetical protein